MKKLILLIILAIAGYCGVTLYQALNDNEPPKVDAVFVDMVQQWKNQMRKENISYKAGFNRIKAIRVVDDYGVNAGHYDKGTQVISISMLQMKKGYFSTRVTLWHELGHYVYNLEHDTDPTKIMFEKSLEELEYKLIWEDMKESYFIKCKNNEWEARL